MAITPKPTSPAEIIARGGSVPAAAEPTKLIQQVTMRIDADLLEAIDEAVEQRPARISRHSWIIEAIVAQLARGGTTEY